MESVVGPFGRYRLLDRLGAGGMAEVYRAVLDGPQGFSRTVALKRILPHLAHDEGFLRLFLDEARISALLHHPAIVQVFDFGAIDGSYFLAMELIDGWTLGQLMQLCKQRLTAVPVADVCYAMSELAGALAHAHALADDSGRPLEIVHRDVSPSNIMIGKQGAVKLLDFGIARAAEHARDERTRAGTRKGKLSYMSPEQTSAARVDRRSDIFSLGVVFYEWLTMRRLFKRDSDVATVLAIREDPIVAPSVHRNGIPSELDAVVMKMLARDPRARYPSCDDVVTDLVPIVQRLRGHTQTLRAFVAKLEAPGDAAATARVPKRAGGVARRARAAGGADRPRGAVGGADASAAAQDAAAARPARARRGRVPSPAAVVAAAASRSARGGRRRGPRARGRGALAVDRDGLALAAAGVAGERRRGGGRRARRRSASRRPRRRARRRRRQPRCAAPAPTGPLPPIDPFDTPPTPHRSLRHRRPRPAAGREATYRQAR